MLHWLLPSLWSKTAHLLQCTWASSGEGADACTGCEKFFESISALREIIRAASAEGQSAASTTVCAMEKRKRARLKRTVLVGR